MPNLHRLKQTHENGWSAQELSPEALWLEKRPSGGCGDSDPVPAGGAVAAGARHTRPGDAGSSRKHRGGAPRARKVTGCARANRRASVLKGEHGEAREMIGRRLTRCDG